MRVFDFFCIIIVVVVVVVRVALSVFLLFVSSLFFCQLHWTDWRWRWYCTWHCTQTLPPPMTPHTRHFFYHNFGLLIFTLSLTGSLFAISMPRRPSSSSPMVIDIKEWDVEKTKRKNECSIDWTWLVFLAAFDLSCTELLVPVKGRCCCTYFHCLFACPFLYYYCWVYFFVLFSFLLFYWKLLAELHRFSVIVCVVRALMIQTVLLSKSRVLFWRHTTALGH